MGMLGLPAGSRGEISIRMSVSLRSGLRVCRLRGGGRASVGKIGKIIIIINKNKNKKANVLHEELFSWPRCVCGNFLSRQESRART